MARRKRNRAGATSVAGRRNSPSHSSNGIIGANVNQTKKNVELRAQRRVRRLQMAKAKLSGNLENMVAQDPKLNGNLVPTVALEKSTRTPISVEKKKPPVEKNVPSSKLNHSPPNRALRTTNLGCAPLPRSTSNRENSKIPEGSGAESPRVEPKKSLSCLNMFAHLYADCKLNGAQAPRVVLKRLNVEQLMQNGVALPAPREGMNKRKLPPSSDLKPRIKSRTRLKTIGTPRNHVGAKGKTQKPHRKKHERQKFEPVPYEEMKWWSSYPLKQVAVRLTKLPLW